MARQAPPGGRARIEVRAAVSELLKARARTRCRDPGGHGRAIYEDILATPEREWAEYCAMLGAITAELNAAADGFHVEPPAEYQTQED